MHYYPICLDIRDRRCLVVGGGAVATRKVKGLLQCGAMVSLVSPQATEELLKLAEETRIVLKARPYLASDLEGMFLVIGATDCENLNLQISKDAETRNILYNIVDRPRACNFILPAIVKRGALTVAISTSGKSPALAKKLRQDLERQFGAEFAECLALLGAIRKKLLGRSHKPQAHKGQFAQLIEKGIVELIKDRRTAEINQILRETFGEGYVYEELIQSRGN